MDQNAKKIIDLRIKKTMAALEKNRMTPYYAETCEDAVKLVESLIKEGETISCGGSVSLVESGVRALMASGKYNFLDRERPGITPEEQDELYHQVFFADTFITSTNAITEQGELFNVDGNCNRVAAILFGPKSVIVVAGYNKITADLDDAILRLKKIAAPANGVRLNTKTPCAMTGECIACTKGEGTKMTSCCDSESRMCRNFVVSASQRRPGRIKVIIVGEELGY